MGMDASQVTVSDIQLVFNALLDKEVKDLNQLKWLTHYTESFPEPLRHFLYILRKANIHKNPIQYARKATIAHWVIMSIYQIVQCLRSNKSIDPYLIAEWLDFILSQKFQSQFGWKPILNDYQFGWKEHSPMHWGYQKLKVVKTIDYADGIWSAYDSSQKLFEEWLHDHQTI